MATSDFDTGISSASQNKDEGMTPQPSSNPQQITKDGTPPIIFNQVVNVATHEFRSYTAENILKNGSGMNMRKDKSHSTVASSSNPVENNSVNNSTVSDSERSTKRGYSNQDGSTSMENSSQTSDHGDERPGTSGLQTQTTVTNDLTPCDAQESNSALAPAVLPENNEQTSSSKDLTAAVLPAGARIYKDTVAKKTRRKRRLEADTAQKKGPKAAKWRKPVESKLEDFREYADLDTLQKAKAMIKTDKPHVLMKTAEIQANRGKTIEAKEALKKVLECLEEHSQVTSEDFLRLGEKCKANGKYFRACMFQAVSAYQHIDEATSHDKFLTDRIFDMWLLVKSMWNGKKRCPDFSPKVHYKHIAELVASFIPNVYDKAFGKDTKDQITGACNKAYALSWIAVAFSEVKQYEDAVTYAEKGKDIMDFAVEDRRQSQTYARLLHSLGFAYYEQNIKNEDALQLLKDALDVKKNVVNYENEDKKEKAIKCTKIRLQQVEKRIKAKKNRDNAKPKTKARNVTS